MIYICKHLNLKDLLICFHSAQTTDTKPLTVIQLLWQKQPKTMCHCSK